MLVPADCELCMISVIFNNCIELIFLAGMYYILSVMFYCVIYLTPGGVLVSLLVRYFGCVCSDCECFVLLVLLL
jgi:hypothetical protein